MIAGLAARRVAARRLPRPRRLRARLHVEPAADPPEPQHGHPAKLRAAGGERLLLRRRSHAAAGPGHGRARRAARGRGLLDGQGRRRAFVATIPVAVDEAVRRARAASATTSTARLPRRARRRQGHPLRARQGADRLVPQRVLLMPDGQIFDMITNGFGLMPAYRWPIPSGRPLGDHRPPARAPARAAGPRRERARRRYGAGGHVRPAAAPPASARRGIVTEAAG